ncbi:hypothetical protein HDU67_008521 [Dinochytrium kinnereticum]|nr:hypothetical protein HDU67_008521 [Dinochytrium kinnereticum]
MPPTPGKEDDVEVVSRKAVKVKTERLLFQEEINQGISTNLELSDGPAIGGTAATRYPSPEEEVRSSRPELSLPPKASPPCPHTTTTRTGSNQFYSQVKCKDCGFLVSKEKKEPVKPKESTLISTPCAHSVTTRKGSNQHCSRVSCKDCGVLISREKKGPEDKSSPSPSTPCSHLKTSKRGSNQHQSRISCVDCGEIVSVEKRVHAVSQPVSKEQITSKTAPKADTETFARAVQPPLVAATVPADKILLNEQCDHPRNRISRIGTNQHHVLGQCLDCGAKFRDWRNPGERMTGVEVPFGGDLGGTSRRLRPENGGGVVELYEGFVTPVRVTCGNEAGGLSTGATLVGDDGSEGRSGSKKTSPSSPLGQRSDSKRDSTPVSLAGDTRTTVRCSSRPGSASSPLTPPKM